jgi:hypothetical protein
VKSLATARKSVKKFQKIAKKVYGDKALTRKQILAIIKRQRRGNRRWQIRGTSAHRLLSPIPTTEVENDPSRVSRNSLKPMKCQVKRFMPLFTRSAILKKECQVGDQTALREDKKEQWRMCESIIAIVAMAS